MLPNTVYKKVTGYLVNVNKNVRSCDRVLLLLFTVAEDAVVCPLEGGVKGGIFCPVILNFTAKF